MIRLVDRFYAQNIVLDLHLCTIRLALHEANLTYILVEIFLNYTLLSKGLSLKTVKLTYILDTSISQEM